MSEDLGTGLVVLVHRQTGPRFPVYRLSFGSAHYSIAQMVQQITRNAPIGHSASHSHLPT